MFEFWDKLTEEQKEQIKQSVYKETYEKGMLMHRCQENCKGLMTVESGQLRAYILSDEGREVTLFRVRAGEVCVLSASCLMDTIAFDVMIEAMEETVVSVLPSVVLNQVMKKNPYVELYLYKAATEKFSDVMWTMQQILFQKIDKRVAGFLWDEMSHAGTQTLSLTHDEIAKYIGSAREVVTRVLKYLAENEVISLGRGRIRIEDKEKLKSFL